MKYRSIIEFAEALILSGFLLFWGGCATQPTKPSPVSIQVDQIREALQGITESYEKKDAQAFLDHLDPSFKGSAELKNQTLQDFKVFSQMEIQLIIDRVQIEEKSIWVAAHWGGVWKTTPEAAPLEKKGHALFRWTSGDHPKLLEIRGDPPFGVFRVGL